MRRVIFLFVAVMVTAASCNPSKTSLFGSRKTEKDTGGTSIKTTTLMPATPIPVKEVEEKLVPNENREPSPGKFFVIIGSFRDPENAKEHQALVGRDGFNSEVLKNDAGLYRVSVMATDDILSARNEIGRIRTKFPVYSDTWLLIRK
jgi:cell division protein FtsN